MSAGREERGVTRPTSSHTNAFVHTQTHSQTHRGGEGTKERKKAAKKQTDRQTERHPADEALADGRQSHHTVGLTNTTGFFAVPQKGGTFGLPP